MCFVVCNDLDVGRKEENGQNSSSATVQRFWASSDSGLKGFVTKPFSVAQPLPGAVSPVIASLCFGRPQKLREGCG